MRSFSEIETAVKRATRGMGFSWGVAEEVGKNIRLLEMFGLPGFKNINQNSFIFISIYLFIVVFVCIYIRVFME